MKLRWFSPFKRAARAGAALWALGGLWALPQGAEAQSLDFTADRSAELPLLRQLTSTLWSIFVWQIIPVLALVIFIKGVMGYLYKHNDGTVLAAHLGMAVLLMAGPYLVQQFATFVQP